jgi:hypothetical protein
LKLPSKHRLNSGWNIATALQESEQRWQNAMMIRKL